MDAVPVALAPSRPCASEETVSTVAFCQCESSRIAWYFARTSAGGLPSLPLAQRNTDGWDAKHQDLRPQAVLGHPAVLVVPLRPFLPLVAAHPAEHQRDAEFVGLLDDVLARELALQPQHVEAEILDVAQDRVLALRGRRRTADRACRPRRAPEDPGR